MKTKITVILLVMLMMLSIGSVSAAPKSPNVSISNYTIDKEGGITPGSTFKVTLDIKNYGENQARKIKVSLNNEQGQENLGKFSPLNQSNIQYISTVDASKMKKITYDMYVSPKIAPGNYNIMVKLSYIDGDGTQYEDTQTIGLLVTEKNSVEILVNDNLGDVMMGEPIETDAQIVNNGVAEVKGISASVVGEGADTPIAYFGNFKSGDYESYVFTIIPEEAGEKTVKISVKYKDSLNEIATVEKDVKYNVLANEDPNSMVETESKGNWFTNFIKGIFGLA